MPSKEPAVVAFIVSLFSILPLFNFFLAPLSCYLGARAMMAIRKQPKKYAGMPYAVFAVLLGFWISLFSLFYLVNLLAGNPIQHLCSLYAV